MVCPIQSLELSGRVRFCLSFDSFSSGDGAEPELDRRTVTYLVLARNRHKTQLYARCSCGQSKTSVASGWLLALPSLACAGNSATVRPRA